MRTDVLTRPWVVARVEQERDFPRLLTGNDYPELCETCRAGIDAAVVILREVGEDYDHENQEAACDFAYDHGWFCGGYVAACQEETDEGPEGEETEKVIYWLAVDATEYRTGWEVIGRWTEALPVSSDNFRDISELAWIVGRALDRRATLGYDGVTAVIEYKESWAEINIDVEWGNGESYALIMGERNET